MPIEVVGPDGAGYRIIAMRRGVPWWSQSDSGGPIEAIAEAVLVTGLEHRSRTRGLGWKIGIARVKTMQFGLGLQHRERVARHADVAPRMAELAELVSQRGAKGV